MCNTKQWNESPVLLDSTDHCVPSEKNCILQKGYIPKCHSHNTKIHSYRPVSKYMLLGNKCLNTLIISLLFWMIFYFFLSQKSAAIWTAGRIRKARWGVITWPLLRLYCNFQKQSRENIKRVFAFFLFYLLKYRKIVPPIPAMHFPNLMF